MHQPVDNNVLLLCAVCFAICYLLSAVPYNISTTTTIHRQQRTTSLTIEADRSRDIQAPDRKSDWIAPRWQQTNIATALLHHNPNIMITTQTESNLSMTLNPNDREDAEDDDSIKTIPVTGAKRKRVRKDPGFSPGDRTDFVAFRHFEVEEERIRQQNCNTKNTAFVSIPSEIETHTDQMTTNSSGLELLERTDVDNREVKQQPEHNRPETDAPMEFTNAWPNESECDEETPLKPKRLIYLAETNVPSTTHPEESQQTHPPSAAASTIKNKIESEPTKVPSTAASTMMKKIESEPTKLLSAVACMIKKKIESNDSDSTIDLLESSSCDTSDPTSTIKNKKESEPTKLPSAAASTIKNKNVINPDVSILDTICGKKTLNTTENELKSDASKKLIHEETRAHPGDGITSQLSNSRVNLVLPSQEHKLEVESQQHASTITAERKSNIDVHVETIQHILSINATNNKHDSIHPEMAVKDSSNDEKTTLLNSFEETHVSKEDTETTHIRNAQELIAAKSKGSPSSDQTLLNLAQSYNKDIEELCADDSDSTIDLLESSSCDSSDPTRTIKHMKESELTKLVPSAATRTIKNKNVINPNVSILDTICAKKTLNTTVKEIEVVCLDDSDSTIDLLESSLCDTSDPTSHTLPPASSRKRRRNRKRKLIRTSSSNADIVNLFDTDDVEEALGWTARRRNRSRNNSSRICKARARCTDEEVIELD